jgi:hypothetical protein
MRDERLARSIRRARETLAMRYLALIYTNETTEAQRTEAEGNALMEAYFQFDRDSKAAGVHRAGEALQPTHTATTVRVREGRMLTTDGPFAETKEQLGGFYLLECANLDEAIAWAAKIPSAKDGSIEVRPIMEFG